VFARWVHDSLSPAVAAAGGEAWQCGCGRLPSRLADTTHDADALPDYPGDLTILMGGYRYHTGDQPGQVMRHGHCDRPRLGG
jgi:hypothetical protein